MQAEKKKVCCRELLLLHISHYEVVPYSKNLETYTLSLTKGCKCY